MANFDNIIQEINTNLPDNNTQAITAAKLRTTMVDFVNAVDSNEDSLETSIQGKQDTLTFDSTPTENSTNPVTSGGIYYALQGVSSTFESGQEVNETYIDDTHLVNPVADSLAKAEDAAVIKDSLSEDIGVLFTGPLRLKIEDNTLINATGDAVNQRCWYIPVSQGDVVKALVTLSDIKVIRYGFCQSIPSEGVSVVGVGNVLEREAEIMVKSPITGYFVINHTVASITSTHKFYIVTMSLPDKIKEIGYFYEKEKNILDEVLTSTSYNYRIQVSTNIWQFGAAYISYILDISTLRIGSLKVTANNTNPAYIAFLNSDTIVNGETPDYAENTGLISVNAEQTATFNVPDGAKYLYVLQTVSQATYLPDAITVDGKYYLISDGGKLTPSQGINYFEVDINTNVLPNGSNEESNIDTNTTVKSAFGIRFPANYTPDGEPCRVMAMFHGYNGYVTPSVLGYTNSNGWVDFQDVFVNAGFVVFDINGYGLNYNTSGNDNHHWGGPGAILTAKKAFEFIKKNYNVKDQMIVFGFSMGGQMGFSYAMNYPEDVIAVALHEPAPPTNNGYLWSLSDIDKQTFADAYGYTDWNAAVADNFANFVGYSIPLSLQYYNNGIYDASGIVNLDLSTTLPSGVTLSGHIDCPIRIWQGEKKNGVGEDRVKKALVENIITALRNGGSNATARYCPGIIHSALKSTQYVIDETLYYVNRYK